MPAKYDQIGTNYNRTRRPDPLLAQNLIKQLQPHPDGLYLDIGCGTGNYTAVFQQHGFQFIGIDPSERMLSKARQNNPAIDWRLGTAEHTGLESASVDGIIGSLTIHHWEDLNAGLLELCRVLKSDGRLVIFTATPAQMRGYWLNHYFPQMMNDSMIQMPTFEKVQTAMTGAGFTISQTVPYSIQPDLQDLFLYSGKHQPDLYFDPSVRHGISSFSSLANQQEIEAGLERMKVDFESGKIYDLIDSYKNRTGDYLYITAKKTKFI